jgi:hypothetical protein
MHRVFLSTPAFVYGSFTSISTERLSACNARHLEVRLSLWQICFSIFTANEGNILILIPFLKGVVFPCLAAQTNRWPLSNQTRAVATSYLGRIISLPLDPALRLPPAQDGAQCLSPHIDFRLTLESSSVALTIGDIIIFFHYASN